MYIHTHKHTHCAAYKSLNSVDSSRAGVTLYTNKYAYTHTCTHIAQRTLPETA